MSGEKGPLPNTNEDTHVGGDIMDEFEFVHGENVECIDEPIDCQLKAPDEKLWYHGRLDRETAKERLLAAGQSGCYLIRESESKPGSFVLSYLGKSGDVTHFRVLAMCGDYYIGGRQFESLSLLIGYYTSYSYLLKGEQLQHPVPPPEPVNDQRRVVAMLPHRKMAETDEISFEKGDVFTVTNALEDGWLWVTNERTGESGIIPAPLVEDLNPYVDPAEKLPYFFANITKEEAIERLRLVGEGSFLIRPSEQFPGAYTIFFLCNREVQRFRIKKVGKQLWLGGKSYDSLEEIVAKYKKEEIKDGHTLGNPVIRDPRDEFDNKPFGKTLSAEQTSDIYASIPQNSGPNLLASRSDRIDLTGYLCKKGETSRKWKSYFFVLNGTKQHLYFFENEKRSKPKGILELTSDIVNCSLYPVHDSFFGRPYCFQLISQYNNNNNQVHYFCAESSDVAQKWIQMLKPYCANHAPDRRRQHKSSMLTEIHGLTVHVFNAINLPSKLLHHPYCVVSLNNVKVCQTKIGESPNPFWNEEFLLDDIPSDIQYIKVSVYNKPKRGRDTEISFVKISLAGLEGLEALDDKLPLQPAPGSGSKGEMGSLRLKVAYMHEMIMSQEQYSSLRDQLLTPGYENILLLSRVCTKSEWIALAKALLRIFRFERLEAILLCSLCEMEIHKESEVSTLFRAASLATTLMDQYMKMTASHFVQVAMKDFIQKVVDSKQSCELNPALMDNASDSRGNTDYFLNLLDEVVEGIFKATDSCPMVLRYVCGCLQKKAMVKWPDDATVKTRVVSGFIFLRLLCPAILDPKSFNLVSETPSETSARTLKLVAKALQNLANLVESGTKESYMEVVKPFIRKNRDKMVMFLDELSNVHSPTDHEVVSGELSRDLATIHHLCAIHIKELQELVETQPTLRKLVTLTEKLSNHKKLLMGNT